VADLLSELERAGIQGSSYSFEPPFNFAKKRKFALSLVQMEDFIILNDDVEVIAPD
jgi:hypothetical protein